MLEMVPELFVDKRSDIIDVAHVTSTMEKKEEEYSTPVAAIQESETNVPHASSAIHSCTSDNSLVSIILSKNIKNKVATLLQKTNLTEKELLKRVKLIKRKTKDKRKRSQLHRVFSHKNSAGCYFNSIKRLKRQNSLKTSKNTKKTNTESSISGSVTSELQQDSNSLSEISLPEKDCTQSEIKIQGNSEDYQLKENKSQESNDALFPILEKISEFNTDTKKDFQVKENMIITQANIKNGMDVISEEMKRNNNDIKINKLQINSNLAETIDLTENEEKNHSNLLQQSIQNDILNPVDLTDDIDDILDELKEDLFQISEDTESSKIIAEHSKPLASSPSINPSEADQEIKINDELKTSCTKNEETEIIFVNDTVLDNEADNQIHNEDPLGECEPKNEQPLKETEEETEKQAIKEDDCNLTSEEEIQDETIQVNENIEAGNESERNDALNENYPGQPNSNKIEEIVNEKAEEITIQSNSNHVKDVSVSLDNKKNDKSQEPSIEINNKIIHTEEVPKVEEIISRNSIPFEEVEEKEEVQKNEEVVQKSIQSRILIHNEEALPDFEMKKMDPDSSTIIAAQEERETENLQEVFEVEKTAFQNSKEVQTIRDTQEEETDKKSLQSEEVDEKEMKTDEHELEASKDEKVSSETKEVELIEIKTDTIQKEDTMVGILTESSEKIHEELQKLLDSDTESQDFQIGVNDQTEESADVEIKTNYFTSLPSTSTAHVEEEEEEIEEESNLNIYSTLYGDDDIRNKIKEQLQLLRQVNRRPLFISKEETASSDKPSCLMDDLDKPSTSDQSSTSKASLIRIENDVLPSTSTFEKELQDECATIAPVTAKEDLKEVLLSNVGELMIVNVVGGYVSDHDDNVESVVEASDKPTVIITGQKSKKISITDKLLIELSQENFHCIKPTKTTDITKIKGWRSKQFNINDEENEETTIEESIEGGDEISQSPVPRTETTINSIEHPIPGTSSNYLPPSVIPEIIPEPTTDHFIKPDNILKQGEKQNEEKNKKSAFVSDELETFLNNNRQLNISYEIPKLVAEEAISKPKSEMPLSNNNYLQVVEKSSYKPKVSKKGKPKTLAEKRRMLEQDRKMQLIHDMSVREDIYLKELAYSKKRNLTEMAEDIRDVLVAEEIPISRTCWLMAVNNSNYCKQFISVHGKRILIAGSAAGVDLKAPRIFPKHSLCNIDERKVCDTSKYKPGPLSKKHKLLKPVVQRNWESHVLKMPRIKLEVYPEYKKPLPLIAQQYLQLCRADQFLISKDWAQLAVTAVQTNKTAPCKKFEYELPYARNQNKLLVRKPAPKQTQNSVNPTNIVKMSNKFAHINVEERIKQVVDDMITCIENQELDKRILKEDPDLRETLTGDKNKMQRPASPVHDPLLHHTIIKRPNVKRNRSTLELRRLNVQVIEVDVNDDEAIPDNCDKDYCKLGCICKSLRGSRSGVPEHCGRENCMFKCKCSFDTLPKGHHSITLPAGTDILSASTMVRLQDEAKKNLAKVEREFTQTVIKANNQTIMVGGGARDRTRRIPKVPKKYSNFAVGVVRGSNEEIDDSSPEKVPEKVVNRNATSESDSRSPESKKLIPIWNKTEGSDIKKKYLMFKKQQTKCVVLLEKLNLKHAIPWCMVHNLYKCYCDGKALPEVPKPGPPQKPAEEQTKKSEDGEYITYNPRFSNRAAEPSVEFTDRFCARTKAVPSNVYQTRNKSEVFKEKYAKIAKQIKKQKLKSPQTSDDEWLPIVPPKRIRDDSNSSDAAPVEQELLVPIKIKKALKTIKKKAKKTRTIIFAAPYSTPLQIEDPLALPEIEKPEDQPIPPEEHCTQSEEHCIPPEEQPLNEEMRLGRDGSHIVSSTTLIDYDKSYTGFITPSKDFVKHFYKMLDLNEHSKIHQIRLLEWQTMASRHKLGLLQVWFNTKRYNNIILTEDRRKPSPSHMNIKHFEKFHPSKFKLPDIISSLLKNTLPGKALEPTETYTIILFDGVNWEARGTIVLSESENICRKKLLGKPTPPSLLAPSVPRPAYKKNTFNLVSTPAMSIELINNEGTAMKLPESNENNEVLNEANRTLVKKCIHVPLPTGSKFNKWFSLILTNNFYSLRISFSNYCIKYTGLEEIVVRAYKQQRTVIIKAPAKDYDGVDENYGIYAVPGFRDRIFFGPYGEHRLHGLETFRYINGKLVNTKYYHKITGNYDNKILGSWFKHTSTAPSYSEISQYVELPSNPELSAEITSTIDKATAQSDFVDLTANDESDSETSNSSKFQEKIDPMLSVLTADFSKRTSSGVSITPVEEPKNKPAPLCKKTNIISVLKEKNDRQLKRKAVDPLAISETPPKQPKLIDSINLEEDDTDMPVLQPFNNDQSLQSTTTNNKQMPVLTALDPKDDEMSKKRLYVITNIPGVGYFELSFRKRNQKRKVLCITILGVSSLFSTINSAIQELHQ